MNNSRNKNQAPPALPLPKPRLSRGKRFVFWLITAFLAVVVCVGALEITARIAHPHWLYYWPSSWLHYDNSLGTLRGIPNYQGYMASYSGKFFVPLLVDQWGFRNPPDASLKAARLAVLGDSFAFGWGVTRRESFAAVAARILGWPAYNLSVPGTDPRDYLLIANRFLSQAPGKIVVVAITFENDLQAFSPSRILQKPAPKSWIRAVVDWTLSHSALASTAAMIAMKSVPISSWIRRHNVMSSSEPLPVGREQMASLSQDTVKVIKEIAQVAKAKRFLVVMVPPRPGLHKEDAYQRFLQVLSEAGLEVLDPAPALSKLKNAYYPIDGHWTPKAQHLVGELLARRLSQ